MQALSFVLPITLQEDTQKTRWRNDPDYLCAMRFQLLLRSFLRTFNLKELDQFLIVCPASNEDEIRDMLHRTTMDTRFRVVREHDICPELFERKKKGKDVPGWNIQQIIKLAAADVFNTDFYLTLDSDIICRKPFDIDSLMPQGKALLNIESIQVYLRNYRVRAALKEWKIKRNRLVHSARLLGYSRKWRYRHRSYGETPVLMHTNSVIDLTSFLAQGYDSWVHCLIENSGWTEYSLMFQFLEMNGNLDKLYRKGNHNAVLDLDASVWKSSNWYSRTRNFSPKSILSCSNERAGPFVAIQSYLKTRDWLPCEYADLSAYYSELEVQLIDMAGASGEDS